MHPENGFFGMLFGGSVALFGPSMMVGALADNITMSEQGEKLCILNPSFCRGILLNKLRRLGIYVHSYYQQMVFC